jgi:hypothetical protein
MKFTLFIIFLLLLNIASAETTFFDQEEIFILNNFSESEVIDNPITRAASSGGSSTSTKECTYQWNCAEWSKCLSSGKQLRNCINIGTCPDDYNFPETEKNCIYASSRIKEKTGEKETAIQKKMPAGFTGIGIILAVLWLFFIIMNFLKIPQRI